MTRTADVDKRSYTLPEVAKLTGLSLRSLQDGCRAQPPRVPHRKLGQQRVMTSADIDRLLADMAVAAEPARNPEVAQFEEYRRQTATRIARKRGRAAG